MCDFKSAKTPTWTPPQGTLGAMDDQKIQLESKLDYDYVKSNFLTYMKSLKDSNKFTMEELEQVS